MTFKARLERAEAAAASADREKGQRSIAGLIVASRTEREPLPSREQVEQVLRDSPPESLRRRIAEARLRSRMVR